MPDSYPQGYPQGYPQEHGPKHLTGHDKVVPQSSRRRDHHYIWWRGTTLEPIFYMAAPCWDHVGTMLDHVRAKSPTTHTHHGIQAGPC